MNLEAHYNKLYDVSINKIIQNNFEIDHLIDSSTDNRFGITLLIRPPLKIKNKIQEFLTQLKSIEPNQYYYNNSDIHITVMSIISCYAGFQLKNINIQDYIDIINRSLVNEPNIEISFKGVTASPSCIMLKGFMNNEALNNIRNNLRENFKNSGLEQSIDKRYTIQTAHSTIIRFKKPLENIASFLNLIEKYKDFDFGSFKVKQLELVYNDWYQKKQHVEKLFQFEV